MLGRKLKQLVDAAGGGERLRIIVLLSSILALNSADLGALGAVAADLEQTLRIGDLALGLAASAVALSAAIATLPVGWLTDHLPRVRMMAASIVLWSVAMLATGAASTFAILLIARLFLGAVQATSGPTLAAMTGDLFEERERSRIFSFIHAGELLGAGVGFIIAGEIAAVLSWRWAFWILAVPGFALALALWFGLPEPRHRGDPAVEGSGSEEGDIAQALVQEQGIEPDPEIVLHEDPARMSVRGALSYLLHIPSNVIMIVSLSLGYFFLGGVQTFGVIFFRGHYGLGQATATLAAATLGLGALVGILYAGRLADRLLAAGRLNARITVSAIGYVLAALLFVPPIVTGRLALALPLFILATAALMAPSAPLDAALLDVIPPGLWGRAEGLQTAVRTLAMALAPVLFGVSAGLFGETSTRGLGQSAGSASSNAGAGGLEVTFLVMLVPILLAGIALLWARRRYPADVAAMQASQTEIQRSRRRRTRRRPVGRSTQRRSAQ